MGRRRRQVVVFLAVLAVCSSAVPLGQSGRHSSHLRSTVHASGHGEEEEKPRPSWPCCDNCGGCTRSLPAQCQCVDMTRGCHPACKDCAKSALSVEPPMYQCMDRITNFCERRCTAAPSAQ